MLASYREMPSPFSRHCILRIKDKVTVIRAKGNGLRNEGEGDARIWKLRSDDSSRGAFYRTVSPGNRRGTSTCCSLYFIRCSGQLSAERSPL